MKTGLFVDKGRELMGLSMKWGLFVDKGLELVVLSMKWNGFMDGMGIFEQKNEERRERKKESRKGGGKGERWRGRERKVAHGERERRVGLRGKIFENVE